MNKFYIIMALVVAPLILNACQSSSTMGHMQGDQMMQGEKMMDGGKMGEKHEMKKMM